MKRHLMLNLMVSKNPMNGQQVTGFIVSGTINRENMVLI